MKLDIKFAILYQIMQYLKIPLELDMDLPILYLEYVVLENPNEVGHKDGYQIWIFLHLKIPMKLIIKLATFYLNYLALENPNEVAYKVGYIIFEQVVLKNPNGVGHKFGYIIFCLFEE